MADQFLTHIGVAAPLMLDNVDTDQIIPSREMKTVSRDGLGEGLFAGWRYTQPGGRELNMEFVLNKPEMLDASVLIAGWNFGCGSSREHAVWALLEYGIRAIVAKSFGEISYENCTRNGILPIVLPETDVERLAQSSAARELAISLPEQTVTSSAIKDWVGRFDIGAYPKTLLMEGVCPIRLTLQSRQVIENYLEQDKTERPWIYT